MRQHNRYTVQIEGERRELHLQQRDTERHKETLNRRKAKQWAVLEYDQSRDGDDLEEKLR